MKVTNKQQIRDYVEYKKRPFSSKEIFEDTGICYKTIRNELKKLVDSGVIKEISQEDGWKRYKKVKKDGKTNTKPNKEVINQVKKIYENNLFLTQKEVSEMIGKTRSSVAMAVKALREEGMDIRLEKTEKLKNTQNKLNNFIIKKEEMCQ